MPSIIKAPFYYLDTLPRLSIQLHTKVANILLTKQNHVDGRQRGNAVNATFDSYLCTSRLSMHSRY